MSKDIESLSDLLSYVKVANNDYEVIDLFKQLITDGYLDKLYGSLMVEGDLIEDEDSRAALDVEMATNLYNVIMSACVLEYAFSKQINFTWHDGKFMLVKSE